MERLSNDVLCYILQRVPGDIGTLLATGCVPLMLRIAHTRDLSVAVEHKRVRAASYPLLRHLQHVTAIRVADCALVSPGVGLPDALLLHLDAARTLTLSASNAVAMRTTTPKHSTIGTPHTTSCARRSRVRAQRRIIGRGR